MKGRPRKYPKTTGYYVYKHILPNAMYYPGMSKQQPSQRWRPSQYKNKSLGPYIEEIGWENIRHIVVKDGLTKEQAEQLEGLLIEEGKRQGLCINKNGSGGKARDNKKEWQREYDQRTEVKQHRREYQREYEKTDKRKEYKHEYEKTDKRKEYLREYDKKRRQTEKWKKYRREYRQTEKYKEYQRQYRLKKKQGI